MKLFIAWMKSARSASGEKRAAHDGRHDALVHTGPGEARSCSGVARNVGRSSSARLRVGEAAGRDECAREFGAAGAAHVTCQEGGTMSLTRSAAKSEAHARKGHRREPTPPKQKDARARKREVLEAETRLHRVKAQPRCLAGERQHGGKVALLRCGVGIEARLPGTSRLPLAARARFYGDVAATT
jgi:hypothetical protein